MIELIYNEEEAASGPEKKLPEPKNVKQVGEPREYKKIFMEDFVHTYLLQYSASKGQKTGIAVLIGSSERAGGKRHLYIKGAIPLEEVSEKQGKYYFSEKTWGKIYEESEKYFQGLEIVGWFLSRPGIGLQNQMIMEETHRTYFSGADKVLFATDSPWSDVKKAVEVVRNMPLEQNVIEDILSDNAIKLLQINKK